jgi:hypothetical protein
VAVGLVVPVVDLAVLLVHAATIIAITAAERRAEPRRAGRTTAVCHRTSVREGTQRLVVSGASRPPDGSAWPENGAHYKMERVCEQVSAGLYTGNVDLHACGKAKTDHTRELAAQRRY